jgi:hypothetical protein
MKALKTFQKSFKLFDFLTFNWKCFDGWANPIKLFTPLHNKLERLSLSGALHMGRLRALPENIRLGWKGLPGTNALAYYEMP